MSDRIQVFCPCCGNAMVVDAETGDVLAEERPKPKPTKTFEDAFHEVKTGESRRKDLFDKAFDHTKRLDDILDKKFEEAKKKAKDDPSKPASPFDAD